MYEGKDLFSGSRLDDYLEAMKRRVLNSIYGASVDDLTGPQKEIIRRHEGIARVQPLSLDADKLSRSPVQETQVNASTLPDAFARGLNPGDDPVYIDAARVVVHIPSAGDTNLWKCQPNSIGREKPRGKIGSQHVSIPIVHPATEMTADRVASDLNEWVELIERWIEDINMEVNRYNSTLFPDIGDAVEKRLNVLQEISSVDDALDIPLSDT